MNRRKRVTIEEFYSPNMVSTLKAAGCPHEDPRGALYCALCRHEYMHRLGQWSY